MAGVPFAFHFFEQFFIHTLVREHKFYFFYQILTSPPATEIHEMARNLPPAAEIPEMAQNLPPATELPEMAQNIPPAAEFFFCNVLILFKK